MAAVRCPAGEVNTVVHETGRRGSHDEQPSNGSSNGRSGVGKLAAAKDALQPSTGGKAGRAKEKAGRAKDSGQQAADSKYVDWLGRAGLAARGVLYIIIGILAVQVAFGSSGHQADKTGALRALGKNPFGEVALWLLVIGFTGMMLWQISNAAFGGPGPDGDKATTRLMCGVRAIVYAVIGFGVAKYAIGLGAPASSDKESQDLTASAMSHPGGRILIVAVGVGFIAGGIWAAYEAARKKFMKQMKLAEGEHPTVEKLGQIGGIARGVVFGTVGVFLIVAGVQSQPKEAKGLDSALRSLAGTPLGPWLLVVVAAGLITYGVYSLCAARWTET
jgi:hypothetical protein